MKKREGFTLIELIVVVAIIGLLISIVISSLGAAKQKGSDTAKIRVLQEVRSALQLYFSDNGSYPPVDQTTLALYLVNGTKKYIASIEPNLKYQAINIDNSICSSNCQSYHLGIALGRSDDKVLSSDKDINAGFAGLSSDCGLTAGTIDYCYDVTP